MKIITSDGGGAGCALSGKNRVKWQGATEVRIIPEKRRVYISDR